MFGKIAYDLQHCEDVQMMDDQAIAAGDPWVLPADMRAELDADRADCQTKEEAAHIEEEILHGKILERDAALEPGIAERAEIIRYIKAKHEKPKADAMLAMLKLDKPLPTQHVDIEQNMRETSLQFAVYDGTPDAIPDARKAIFNNALAAFDVLLTETETDRKSVV